MVKIHRSESRWTIRETLGVLCHLCPGTTHEYDSFSTHYITLSSLTNAIRQWMRGTFGGSVGRCLSHPSLVLPGSFWSPCFNLRSINIALSQISSSSP